MQFDRLHLKLHTAHHARAGNIAAGQRPTGGKHPILVHDKAQSAQSISDVGSLAGTKDEKNQHSYCGVLQDKPDVRKDFKLYPRVYKY